MNQDTQTKFAAILAAAQAKTAKQVTPKFKAIQEPIKQPVIQPEVIAPVPAQQLPELSTFTFDSLIADIQPEAITAEPIKAALQIVDYSDKAIAVIGDTKPNKEQLKQLGGRFNMYLKCGPGWIFSKTKESIIKNTFGI